MRQTQLGRRNEREGYVGEKDGGGGCYPGTVKSSPYEKQPLEHPLSQHPSGEEVLCLQG